MSVTDEDVAAALESGGPELEPWALRTGDTPCLTAVAVWGVTAVRTCPAHGDPPDQDP